MAAHLMHGGRNGLDRHLCLAAEMRVGMRWDEMESSESGGRCQSKGSEVNILSPLGCPTFYAKHRKDYAHATCISSGLAHVGLVA